MKAAPFLLGLAIAMSGLRGAHAATEASCLPAPDPSSVLYAGRDSHGFFVKVQPLPGRAPAPKHLWVSDVGDFLAGAAGATAFYFGSTENPLAANEWRSEDPLVLLKAFCAAAGLEVETPQPGFWIIGPPWFKQRSAVLVSAQPMDPTEKGFLLAAQAGDMERALVAQLPIREGHGKFEVSRVDVSYYWLPEEGRDILLVAVTKPAVLDVRPQNVTAFKVKLNRLVGRIDVQCLWSADEIEGPLNLDIKEDFGGDGFRDFVFHSMSSKDAHNVAISGRTGEELFSFFRGPLVVEKRASGPKRVAVYQPTLVQLLAFNPETSEFAEIPASLKAAKAATANETVDEDSGWQQLAAVVGGPSNVVVYGGGLPNKVHKVLTRAEEELRRSVEYRLIHSSGWLPNPTADDIARGYPARIVYSWESEGFKEERERHESNIRN